MISIKDLTVNFGGIKVLDSCSMDIAEGQKVALMGSSGSGKTTLLKVIAGITAPNSGELSCRGRISYVFQEPRLFPWMTAAENIAAVLPKGAELKPWLEAVGLAEDAAKYPHELSGGMQQRLSIARALAFGGDILLLDEPLQGLDTALREQICRLIKEQWADKTMIVVTHDESEAKALANVIYDYKDGKFEKRDSLLT